MWFCLRMIASDLNQQQDELNNKINETAKLTQERAKLNEKLSSLEHQYDLLSVHTLQKKRNIERPFEFGGVDPREAKGAL